MMLQSIRDNTKGWIAYAIIIFLSIPFAFVGIQSYLSGGGSQVAAEVNDTEISVNEVNNIVRNQKQQLAQIFKNNVPEQYSDENIKKQAIEQVVQQALQTQNAEELGLRASNSEVANYIKAIPNFSNNGQFDAAKYTQVLKAQRTNQKEFESRIRQQLSVGQVDKVMLDSAIILPNEAKTLHSLEQQKRNAEMFTNSFKAQLAKTKVSNDEAKAYYEAHLEQYLSEEKVELGIVRVKKSALVDGAKVTDEDLQTHFLSVKDSYAIPEKRLISHIQFRINGDDETKAKADAEEALAAIKAKKLSFEEAAKKYSTDSLSKDKGGDLGTLQRGDMGIAFDTVAFSDELKQGQISDVFKNGGAFQLAQVRKITPKVEAKFADVKAELEKDLKKRAADKRFIEKVETLEMLAYENEGTLEPAASDLGAEIITTEAIGRNAEQNKGEYGRNSLIVKAAFSDSVLGEGKNSELIKLASDDVAIIRVLSHQKSEQLPFEQVAKKVREDARADKALIAQKSLQQSLTAKLSADGWGATAKGQRIENKKAVARDSKLDNALKASIFSATPKVAQSIILDSGDVVTYQVTSIESQEKELSPAEKDKYKNYVLLREIDALKSALKNEADVKVYPKNLD